MSLRQAADRQHGALRGLDEGPEDVARDAADALAGRGQQPEGHQSGRQQAVEAMPSHHETGRKAEPEGRIGVAGLHAVVHHGAQTAGPGRGQTHAHEDLAAAQQTGQAAGPQRMQGRRPGQCRQRRDLGGKDEEQGQGAEAAQAGILHDGQTAFGRGLHQQAVAAVGDPVQMQPAGDDGPDKGGPDAAERGGQAQPGRQQQGQSGQSAHQQAHGGQPGHHTGERGGQRGGAHGDAGKKGQTGAE